MAAKVKAKPKRGRPRSMGRLMPPTLFTQPKASSMRLRIRWLVE